MLVVYAKWQIKFVANCVHCPKTTHAVYLDKKNLKKQNECYNYIVNVHVVNLMS